MDLLNYFIKSIIVGFSVSVPLGPIGVLCIQRTINKGQLSGFFSGFGAALSDTVYAIIAGFGLTYVISFIEKHQLFFQLIGAVVLIMFGISTFSTNPIKQLRKQRQKGNNIFSDIISTFFITISNPLALFVFIAVFAGFGLVNNLSDFKTNVIVILGILTGASLWWYFLTTIVNLFRRKINLRRLWWLNKIAGGIIILFSIVAIIALIVTNVF